MNNDAAEKVEGIIWGFIKWFVFSLFVISILGVFFWAIFYYDLFANLPFVILARNWYQKTYIQAQSFISPGHKLYSIYTIQEANPPENGVNTYTFYGSFLSFDLKNDILALQGIDGKTYNFTPGGDLIIAAGKDGVIHLADNSVGNHKTKSNIIKSDNSIVTSQSVMQITWDDTRTIYQIDQAYAKNNTIPLNQNSTQIFSLTKFN